MKLYEELSKGLDNQKIDLPETQIARLVDFVNLLDKWNKVYNLTAVRDPELMINRHLLDSLTVQPFVEPFESIADLGSGGGLPGIPLAICNPHKRLTLIDSNVKKTRFLVQVVASLNLKNVTVIHDRTERYRPANLFQCLTARAFAAPSKIISIASHLCSASGSLVLMAGLLDDLDLSGGAGFHLQSTTPVHVYNEMGSRNIIVFERNGL